MSNQVEVYKAMLELVDKLVELKIAHRNLTEDEIEDKPNQITLGIIANSFNKGIPPKKCATKLHKLINYYNSVKDEVDKLETKSENGHL